MDRALEEVRLGKQNGACGVFLRSIEIDNRLPHDPYFYPLYEEASALDMPVCIHTGHASPELSGLYTGEAFTVQGVVGIGSFLILLSTRLPEKFPRLRWGLIEFTSGWVPYAVRNVRHRMQRRGVEIPQSVVKDNRIYIACQTHDDIPYVVSEIGEDNLVIGTDYGHSDPSTHLQVLAALSSDGGLNERVRTKIAEDNARALYAI
jgi:predicted TIM-barrel fold metal-dependent hydrolase